MKRSRDAGHDSEHAQDVRQQLLFFGDVGLQLVSHEQLVDPYTGGIIPGIVGSSLEAAAAIVQTPQQLDSNGNSGFGSANSLSIRRVQHKLQPVAQGFPALQFFTCPEVTDRAVNSDNEELTIYTIQDNRSLQAPAAGLLMAPEGQPKPAQCPFHFFPCSCHNFRTVGTALRRLHDEFNEPFDWDVYVAEEEERRNYAATSSGGAAMPRQRPRPTLTVPKQGAYGVGSGLQSHVEVRPIGPEAVRAPDLWYQMFRAGNISAARGLYEAILAGTETDVLGQVSSLEELQSIARGQQQQWCNQYSAGTSRRNDDDVPSGYAPLAVIVFLNVSAEGCPKPPSVAANPHPCTHALLLVTTSNAPLTLARRIIGPIALKDSDTPLSIMSALALHTSGAGKGTPGGGTFPHCNICKGTSTSLIKCPACNNNNICSALNANCPRNQCCECGVAPCSSCLVTVSVGGVSKLKCLECLVLEPMRLTEY